MLVSTKGRYALRVMIDLAKHNDGTNIKLQDIAGRQLISEKYLESIMVLLSKAHLVDAVRGTGGGYRLNRSPREYNIDEILELTESSLAPVSCVQDTSQCNKRADCLTLPMWSSLDEIIHTYLKKVTLQNLLDQNIPLN
ncbi:MAG: Rrf2 family transcriptional regulator [Erysipelotrichia bacterium]|nr:Rrf2 family transcriptional regulator [Erysipelotrichia bacterium]